MVGYTGPSGKSSLETVWKRAVAFKQQVDEPSVSHNLSQANFNQSDHQ